MLFLKKVRTNIEKEGSNMKYDIQVKLGAKDLNTFSVIKKVREALRENNVSVEEIRKFSSTCITKKTFEDVLKYIEEIVTVVDESQGG